MLSSAAPGAVLAAFIALVLAGCGDEDSTTTEAKPSPEQKIEQTGNKWAPLFAAAHDFAACKYQTQPLCDRTTCEHVGGPEAKPEPIRNCTPPSSAFRKSFEDATVQDIAIKGERAGAKLSNGELVEFVGVQPAHCVGSACPQRPRPDHWLVSNLGGNAGKKYFE
jgi:hypothetical protein